MDQHPAPRPALGADQTLWRARFEDLWARLDPLTVIAALPGWGRSTWLRQCAEHLAATRPSTAIRWVRTRDALTSLLDAPPTADAVVLVEDVPLPVDDELWQSLADAAEAHSTVRFIVATIDTPLIAVHGAARVLDERDLAFDDDEVSRFGPLLAEAGANVDIGALPPALKGCPLLIHRLVTRSVIRGRQSVWPTPDPAPELHLNTLLLDRWRRGELAGSHLARALHDARYFRRFAADLLADSPEHQRILAAQLPRLAAMPFVVEDPDDESDLTTFAWTSPVWEQWRGAEPSEEDARGLAAAHSRVVAGGRTAGSLFYPLALGNLDEAEALVLGDYRRFLVFTDSWTTDELLERSPEPSTHPALALLAGEMRARRGITDPRWRSHGEQALVALPRLRQGDADEEFDRASILAYAAVTAGQRSLAHRYLAHMRDLDIPGLAAGLDDPARVRLVGNLYLAYWAALQSDAHVSALRIATLMAECSRPGDQLYALEKVSLTTEQDLAGTRSEDPDGARPSAGDLSHAQSLLDLEDCDDRAAVNYLRPAIGLAGKIPSRSAIDALTLLVRAVGDLAGLSAEHVGAVVDKSRELWSDGRPSSFVAFAAMLAYSATAPRRDGSTRS